MNAGLHDSDASIHYYDSDYPSTDHARHPENLDATTRLQGIASDVERYLELCAGAEGPILEVGCGTGRVAIPLARAGHCVHALDASEGMLARFRAKLEREPPEVVERITLERADATCWERRDGQPFAIALLPFNTLPCIADFDAQRAVLRVMRRQLTDDGQLLIDLINPFLVRPQGDPVAKPFFTRRNEWTGRTYTRFAMLGPMDVEHRQELRGWYDELADDGAVMRRHYSILWRPLQRYELQLMLAEAGFAIEALDGGHGGEPFTTASPRMFVRALCRANDR